MARTTQRQQTPSIERLESRMVLTAGPTPEATLMIDALSQVHDSLDALTRADVHRAYGVMGADRRVDRQYRSVLKLLKEEIVVSPQRINTWLRLINTARNLERIADHASKIAEAVVYLKDGEILRHRAAGESARPHPKLSS